MANDSNTSIWTVQYTNGDQCFLRADYYQASVSGWLEFKEEDGTLKGAFQSSLVRSVNRGLPLDTTIEKVDAAEYVRRTKERSA